MFNRDKKAFIYVKRVIKILISMVCVISICKLLDFMYVEENLWSRKLYHSLYEQENIDNLFIGSSHVYCGVSPSLIDKYIGGNNFSFATDGQLLLSAYDSLEDVLGQCDVKNVYLEMYYVLATGEYAKEQENVSWVNWYYQKPSLRKYKKFASASPNQQLEAIFPFVRFREHLFDVAYINRRIIEKKSEAYANYENHNDFSDGNGYGDFVDKGEYWCTRKYTDGQWLCKTERTNEELQLNEYMIGQLDSIVSLCKERGINVTLFTVPVYEEQISSINYDIYYNSVNDYAESRGLKYYDFNLCKGEFLPIQERQFFMDIGHLNTYGAIVFMDFFMKIISGEIQDSEKYFYESYTQKMISEPAKVYGMYVNTFDNNDVGKDTLYIVASGKEKMEYKIVLDATKYDEDGNEVNEMITLQDFSDNDRLAIDREVRGTIYLDYRYKDNFEDVKTLKFIY